MDERICFIADCTSGLWTMTELCERHAISRKTGYKWLERYRLDGAAGLAERSCAPLVHGRVTGQPPGRCDCGSAAGASKLGARKIVARACTWTTRGDLAVGLHGRRDPERAGLVCGRRLRRRAPPRMGQLTVPQHANHVWGVDHKGWIRLGDGSRAEPLTMTDGFSRYLISLTATGSTRHDEAKPLFDRAFRDHGLPEVIRSDNGSPFRLDGHDRADGRCRCGGSSWVSGMSGSIPAVRSRTAGTSASI